MRQSRGGPDISIEHIPGIKNDRPDALSRIYSSKPVCEAMLQDLK